MLREIFKAASKPGMRHDVISLFERLEKNPTLAPYVGDMDTIKNVYFRLNQEGIVKGRMVGDNMYLVEEVRVGSQWHAKIDLLLSFCERARSDEEFKDLIHASELNQHFLDDAEILSVYHHVKNTR